MRPSRTTFWDLSTFIWFILSMIGCLGVLPRIINWNFFGLTFIEFSLNHLNKVTISYLRSSKIIFRSFWELYMVLSSAKLEMFVLSIKRERSLINKLNKNGPIIDLCGTPLTISHQYTKNLFLYAGLTNRYFNH